MRLLYISEIQILSYTMIVVLSIAGLLFTALFILYNLNNIYANRIKDFLKAPVILLKRNKNISEFFTLIHNKFIIPVFPGVRKITQSFLDPFLLVAARGVKKNGSILYKFDSIYLNNALNNIEESILFLGLIARKIHTGNIRTYSMYLLAFIIIFYFIFRTM